MNTKSAYVVMGMAAVFVMTALLVAQQHAKAWPRTECKTRDAIGAFGFVVEGQLLEDNELGLPAGPYAGTGRVQFDYDGSWSAVTSYSVDGIVAVDVPMEGTWSVSSDCGFTLSQQSFGTAKGTLVDGGNEVALISVNPGSAGTLRGLRVGTH